MQEETQDAAARAASLMNQLEEGKSIDDTEQSITAEDGEFTLKIPSVALFNIMSSLHCLVEEAAFHIDSNGIAARVVDPSHVAMMQVIWGKPEMASAENPKWDKEGTYGIELSPVKKFCMLGKKWNKTAAQEWVTLSPATIGEKPCDGWMLQLDNIQRTIRRLDPERAVIPRVPDIKTKQDKDGSYIANPLLVLQKDLLRSLRAMDQVGDLVNFQVEERDGDPGLTLSVSQGDRDSVNYWIPAYVDEQRPPKAGASSQYSLQYLLHAVKSMAKDAEITVWLGPGYPLLLETEMDVVPWNPDMNGNFIPMMQVAYFLAPRSEG